MRAGSLFSGCGGLDIAVKVVFGAEPAWLCEADPKARAVLERHLPGVPIIPDVREIDAGVERVDVMHGGYPCQPFSVAGKRGGGNDPRHLWPEFARCVRLLRPRLVVLENVAGHLALGFDSVLGDLAEAGFDAEWVVVRASDVGAPHRRERLFCVAWDTERCGRDGWPSVAGRDTVARTAAEGPSESAAADTRGERLSERAQLDGEPDEDPAVCQIGILDRPGDGEPERPDVSWGVYEPAIRRWERTLGAAAPRPTDDRGRLMPEFVEWMMGFPVGWTDGVARTHRLRMLGNAVVPHQAALALRVLTSPG